jgi:hypothetical protein
VDLPVYKGKPIVLVPRDAIRRDMSVNSGEYYREHILPYLQMEHLNQNTALCRVLKSGKRKGEKAPPWKKDVQAAHPPSKDEIFKFTKKHPDVLKKYKDEAAAKSVPLSAADIEAVITKASGVTLDGINITVVNQKGAKVMLGNNVGGDNIAGNVGGSSIVNARDIKVYKNHLDSTTLHKSLKAVLIKAREQAETMGLSHADKSDVADDIGALTTELEKPEHDEGRIIKILKRVGAIAPPVLAVLQSAKILAGIVAGTPTP